MRDRQPLGRGLFDEPSHWLPAATGIEERASRSRVDACPLGTGGRRLGRFSASRRDARIAEIGVAELALDDIERHAFADMERGAFVRRTGSSGDAARHRARQRAAEMEEHADRLEREREEWMRAAVAAERAGSPAICTT
jgi:hypothetical protein